MIATSPLPGRTAAAPPKVALSNQERLRFVIVAAIGLFAMLRVVPDAIRIVSPLGLFGYATNANGVVVSVPARPPQGADRIEIGDRVLIARIPRDARKPGLAGVAFTREDFDRYLPVERAGTIRVLHLVAQPEPVEARATIAVRVAIFVASVMLGGMLFLLKPSVTTAAFYAFCLGGSYPTTYSDSYYPVPYREIPRFAGDLMRGFAAPGLLLFAACLYDRAFETRRAFTASVAAVGVFLGLTEAFASWARDYGAVPAETFAQIHRIAQPAVMGLAIVVALLAYRRADRMLRPRYRAILIAFVVSAVAAALSAWLFPEHLSPWINALLQTAPIAPIALVWFAVLRHNFFNIDFVVGRGIVFFALAGFLLGIFIITEDIVTYIFYSNSDIEFTLLYLIIIVFSLTLGKVQEFLSQLVDRFIFRGRESQRLALEYIAGYILDAESADDVYRALLLDAPHALQLTFAGVFTREPSGDFVLHRDQNWPESAPRVLRADDPFVVALCRARNVLTFSADEKSGLAAVAPGEHFSFVAPIFSNRTITGIVIYGPNVSGLDLDPDERELLVSAIAHASIALGAIELAAYRTGVPVSDPLLGTG